jgi:hypothetical protein
MDDAFRDGCAEPFHAHGKPGRDAAAMQGKIGMARAMHHFQCKQREP